MTFVPDLTLSRADSAWLKDHPVFFETPEDLRQKLMTCELEMLRESRRSGTTTPPPRDSEKIFTLAEAIWLNQYPGLVHKVKPQELRLLMHFEKWAVTMDLHEDYPSIIASIWTSKQRLCCRCDQWSRASHAAVPCGHRLYCQQCAAHVQARPSPSTCPRCRTEIASFLEIKD